MTGLSILYASEGAKERDWAVMPDRDRAGRLCEVYWAHRTKSRLGRKSFVNMTLNWRPDRAAIGRRSHDPGMERDSQQAAGEFRGNPRGLRLRRLSRIGQRGAADHAIEKKLAKASYRELLERYGYGTLVVGMPLWFAVPPNDPFRAENAIDDFVTRTTLGLEEVRRRVLRRRDCPFRKVIVIWDTTPQALHEWCKERSAQYEDAANASLGNPTGASLWGVLSDGLEQAISKTATPESEAPSMSLHVHVEARKKVAGRGPYPELVKAFG